MRKKLHERIEVLYEDRDVIVAEKAAGILSYPVDGRDEESAIRLIRRYWKIQNRKQEHVYLLHRLDKETSGLIAFAKTTLARNSLSRQFEEHGVVRCYLAVTCGIPAQERGTIQTFLARDQRGKRAVSRKGRPAVTLYRVVLVNRQLNRALVRCYLHTGRTHQVRIHMAHLNTPVVGDAVYGVERSGRMALHAEVLGFIHPRTDRPVLIRSSLPQELSQLLGARCDRVYFQSSALR
ncbi:RluA family pseudouridine synthase [bacterium]|nr:RluA family pseudouridine synthase [bacterium]